MMLDRPDTGAELRSLYAPEGGVRAIFSGKVAEYIASRPDYPQALFDALVLRCPPVDGATAADVGAGTGLLTRGLLASGYRATAVEPNPAMREACDLVCGAFAGYRSVEGAAESMPLAPGSIDLVTAAQAFHWFDVEAARAECLRVLTPRGIVALAWNDRVGRDPLHVALDDVFAEFGGAKRGALLAHEDRSDLPRFFGTALRDELAWPHAHRLDADGLLCLVLSRSYMPDRSTAAGHEVACRVREIHERFQQDGTVTVRYQTVAVIGRPA
jgi:SAM-dependent methyltransferase